MSPDARLRSLERSAASGWTWVEPFAGAAACALRLVGGPSLDPPVSWMGGKRRLAADILAAMGVPPGQPQAVVLNDAGPWGWVWPLLLRQKDGRKVAEVLRSWAGEEASLLWQRLADQGQAEDLHERAAQWLWIQARSASGVPMWWAGERWEKGNKDGRVQAGGRGQRGSTWRMGDAEGGERGASQNGKARGGPGGIQDPCTIADRIEAIGWAFSDVPWCVTHQDAMALDPAWRGAFVLLDPPYRHATGYGWNISRADLVHLAQRWEAAGAPCVAVCEAEPVDVPGWRALDLTRPGGKPEWLTLSRPPARLPQRQGDLFAGTSP